MDRLETMRVFVSVAEAGGFASAARRLALSPPAVTRAIAALEDRIGTRLLHRTTRVVRLTEAGARFLTDCRRLLHELELAEATAAGAHEEARGQLAVTASVTFGRMFVAPIVLRYLAMEPKVTARTFFVDRVVDLLDEGIDVAVRIARLPDSSLTAVRVGTVRRVLCAAPSYLAQRGTPRRPKDLVAHQIITLDALSPELHWSFASGRKAEVVSLTPRLVANTADVAIGAARAGLGITRVLSYTIEAEVKAGHLEVVLPSFEPPSVPIHLVYAEGRRATAKVRGFIDLAASTLRSFRLQ
jgi:DNA-binding transcriptional LysR family regulator